MLGFLDRDTNTSPERLRNRNEFLCTVTEYGQSCMTTKHPK